MIEIVSKGLLTTIQDNGRHAYQRYGVPVAGAMDKLALSLGNILVGNDPLQEVLECTLIGPTLRFHKGNIFALTGADFPATLNGEPVEHGRALFAPAGSVLALGTARSGCRGYLAFSGGLEADEVMGSKSTYQKGGIGGHHGRALKDGDRISFPAPKETLPNLPFRRTGESFLISYTPHPVVRVILGPQEDYFTDAGIRTLFEGSYTVTPQNDRMGYRLKGPGIQLKEGEDGNIISDGVSYGAIQVTDGQPIIMMADRQTTGGYAKIACVISVDLPLVAQLKTGDTLRFVPIDVRSAQTLYIDRLKRLAEFRQFLDGAAIKEQNLFKLRINGKQYHIVATET